MNVVLHRDSKGKQGIGIALWMLEVQYLTQKQVQPSIDAEDVQYLNPSNI